MALHRSQSDAAETPKEWFDLFRQVVASLPRRQACLVVDLATVRYGAAPGSRAPEAFNVVQELYRHMLVKRGDEASKHGTAKVNVILLHYEANGFGLPSDDVLDFVVPVKINTCKRPRAGRGRGGGRGRRV